MTGSFDPIAILAALERHRASYIVVGELAGVLHGSDFTTTTIEITPALKRPNLERLTLALADLGVPHSDLEWLSTLTTDAPRRQLDTDHGEVAITATPAGTRGYDDLRRGATREPLGHGIRAAIASLPDLIRTLDADRQNPELEQRLRRMADLERSTTRDL